MTRRLLRLFIKNLRKVPTLILIIARALTRKRQHESEYVRRMRDLVESTGELGDQDEKMLALVIEISAETQRNAASIHRTTVKNYVFYGIVTIMMMIVAIFIGQVSDISQQTQDLAKKNTEGIRVSCIVTANVVVMSGAAPRRSSGGPKGRPPRLSAQQQLTALRISAIRKKVLTPGQRRQERHLIETITSAGGLSVPDCKAISEHPDRVKPFVPNRSVPGP